MAAADGTRHCIYCDRDKPEDEFSLEHILPHSIARGPLSDRLKTDQVCKSCNQTIGRYVDASFLKNWFLKAEGAEAARRYVDLSTGSSSTLPFHYVGAVNSLPIDADQVCEVWLGPCGARVYHVHQRNDPQFDSFAGGDAKSRRKDPGRAFLIITADDSVWIPIVLRSFRTEFRDAKRYAVNFGVVSADIAAGLIQVPDGAATILIEALRADLNSMTSSRRSSRWDSSIASWPSLPWGLATGFSAMRF